MLKKKPQTERRFSNPDLTVPVTDPAEKTKRPVKFRGTAVSKAVSSDEETELDSIHVLLLGGATGFACIAIVFVFGRRRADSKSQDEDKSGGDRTDFAVPERRESSLRGSNDTNEFNIPTEVKTNVSTIRPSHSASVVFMKQLEMDKMRSQLYMF